MSVTAEQSSPAAHLDAASGEGTPAALWIPDEDLRLLVRGVLALEHHPVMLEGSGPEFLRLLGRPEREVLLFLDAHPANSGWREQLTQALEQSQDLLPIVLLPQGEERLREDAYQLGARATVARPIVLRELIRTIQAVAPGPTTRP